MKNEVYALKIGENRWMEVPVRVRENTDDHRRRLSESSVELQYALLPWDSRLRMASIALVVNSEMGKFGIQVDQIRVPI